MEYNYKQWGYYKGITNQMTNKPINQLHGAESFLSSSCYLCQSRHSVRVTEPTVFTRPTTFRYPEPDKSNQRFSLRFLRTHFDIILPSMTKFYKLSLPLTFPTKTLYEFLLFHTCYTSGSSHFIDLITRIIWYESWSSLLFSLFRSPVTSSLLCPGVSPGVMFSNIICLYSFLKVGDQNSYPNNTTGYIIFPYISIFAFFG